MLEVTRPCHATPSCQLDRRYGSMRTVLCHKKSCAMCLLLCKDLARLASVLISRQLRQVLATCHFDVWRFLFLLLLNVRKFLAKVLHKEACLVWQQPRVPASTDLMFCNRQITTTTLQMCIEYLVVPTVSLHCNHELAKCP